MIEVKAKAGVIGHIIGCILSQQNIEDASGYKLIEIAYLCQSQDVEEKERIRLISEIPTIQSETDILGGFIFVSYLSRLIDKETPLQAYQNIKRENYIRFSEKTRREYYPILQQRIEAYDAIKEVTNDTVSILKAALWCLITTNDFEHAILKAIELNSSAACALTGAMAGVYYDIETIPREWLCLAKRRIA